MASMVLMKQVEISSSRRDPCLRFVAFKLDPFFGKIVFLVNFFSAEVIADIIRFLAAKLGLWVARALFSLRNFSSKLASHLYHTSRKVESGDPATSHPSFFIKAILEFRDKMREDREGK